jgi:glycosyltransferase involved in cell wall biosynthesis
MPIRILYITNKISPPGGLERVLAIKTSSLAEDFGYEVHILTLNQGNEPVFHDFSPKIQMHDVEVKGNPFVYLWQYASKIQAKVAEIQPDVIDVCDDGLKGFFLPLILGRRKKLVYERHVSKVIEFNAPEMGLLKWNFIRFKFFLMDFLALYFSRFVVLTPGNVAEWKCHNLEVISNPLTFLPETFSSLENKKVIAVGRHVFQKGFELLLQAWARLMKDFPDWKLEIYGNPESGVDLFALRQSLGLEQSVALLPPEKNIEEKYLEASVYALSSRFEGFGMVLIEAMACGVPCVSFDCPCGPSDIIENGVDGLLVENGNVEKLASGLAFLMKNEAERKRMGQVARHSVQRFSKKETMEKWDQLFRKLVKMN